MASCSEAFSMLPWTAGCYIMYYVLHASSHKFKNQRCLQTLLHFEVYISCPKALQLGPACRTEAPLMLNVDKITKIKTLCRAIWKNRMKLHLFWYSNNVYLKLRARTAKVTAYVFSSSTPGIAPET